MAGWEQLHCDNTHDCYYVHHAPWCCQTSVMWACMHVSSWSCMIYIYWPVVYCIYSWSFIHCGVQSSNHRFLRKLNTIICGVKQQIVLHAWYYNVNPQRAVSPQSLLPTFIMAEWSTAAACCHILWDVNGWLPELVGANDRLVQWCETWFSDSRWWQRMHTVGI
jgi:hypothetical protein